MTKKVVCVETLEEFFFDAETNEQAIDKMIYTLELKKRCSYTVKNTNKKGLVLDCDGKTYYVKK